MAMRNLKWATSAILSVGTLLSISALAQSQPAPAKQAQIEAFKANFPDHPTWTLMDLKLSETMGGCSFLREIPYIQNTVPVKNQAQDLGEKLRSDLNQQIAKAAGGFSKAMKAFVQDLHTAGECTADQGDDDEGAGATTAAKVTTTGSGYQERTKTYVGTNYAQNGIISVTFGIANYSVDAAHPNGGLTTINLDTTTGKVLQLSDILMPDYLIHLTANLTQYAKNEAAKDTDKDDAFETTSCMQQVVDSERKSSFKPNPSIDDFAAFEINETGININLDEMNSDMAFACGGFTVPFKWAQFEADSAHGSYLTTYGKTLVARILAGNKN